MSKDIVGDATPAVIHALDEAIGDFGGSIRFEDGAIATAREVLSRDAQTQKFLDDTKAECDAAFEARVPATVSLGVRVPPGLLEALEEAKRYTEGRVTAEWLDDIQIRVVVSDGSGNKKSTRCFTLARGWVGTDIEATPENIHRFVRDALRAGP